MRKAGTKAALFVAVCFALSAIACSDPYGACAKAYTDIGASITAGMKTVSSLNQQHMISGTETANVLGYLEYANKADEAFGSCINAAHTSKAPMAFTSCAQTFNTTLNDPAQLALVHVANPSASQTITSIVNGLTTGISTVLASLGGN